VSNKSLHPNTWKPSQRINKRSDEKEEEEEEEI
jgi:hypothetical protein